MSRIELKGKQMEMGFNEDDISELINSLHNIGRVLRKIEKKLGIKEAPLPIIDLEENFKQTEERDDYNKLL